VLFDAATGQVLAAATAPSFDPNGLTLARMQAYVQDHTGSHLLTNKALSRAALFFPGSTFKLLTAAAALEGPVSGRAVCRSWNGRELTWSYGGVRYRRKVGAIHDYGDHGHGTLSLDDGLARGLTVSCNVFFATLATRIGPERLSHALHEAGLTVAPEPATLAPYLAEAGFGQIAVKAAPVEMARLAGAIGRSGGDYPGGAEPYWVAKIVDAGGQTTVPSGLTGSPVATAYRPFSPAVARRLRELMLGVVNDPSGTAYHAFHGPDGAAWLPDLEIGGKTGTAEFDKLVRTRTGRRVPVRGKHAWFVGFAQERRRFPPRTLAFAVLVEDARGRATGGTVCAPLAREMLAQVFPPAGAPSTTRRQGDWFGNFLDRVGQGVESARRLRRWFSR
jgi:cell division protein FtsI/penicillin-binding protein 2